MQTAVCGSRKPPAKSAEKGFPVKMFRILRRIFVFLLILVLLFGGCALWLWHSVQQEPEFYRALAITPETRADAEKDSASMEAKVRVLRHQFRKDGQWKIIFTEDEFNHWLAIAIGEKRPGMVPHQLKDPRGVILEDRILAGIRVDTPEFKGVVSVEVFPSVSSPNTVDIELKNVSAGTISVPPSLLEKVLQQGAREASLPVEVLHENGRTILRFRFQDGDLFFEKHSIEVRSITLKGKALNISGTAK